MRPSCFALVLGLATVLAVGRFSTSIAEPTKSGKAPEKKAAEAAQDWKDDPVCRMVFFAVLEGLYTDGVPNAVVDSVVPRKEKDGRGNLKTSFVIECPLCHPVYEAFSLYQRRQPFEGARDGRDTFGKGTAPELKAKLESKDARTRLGGLQVLVKRWVEHRLNTMRLTEKEKKEWVTRLGERSRQGVNRLSGLLGKDPNYKGWSTYWGCAACNATTAAGAAVKTPAKKE